MGLQTLIQTQIMNTEVLDTGTILPMVKNMASTGGQYLDASHNIRRNNEQGVHTLTLPPICVTSKNHPPTALGPYSPSLRLASHTC